MGRNSERSEVAVLEAFDKDGRSVEKITLDLHIYYDECHPLIDSDHYRKKQGIRRVRGTLYNQAGNIIQQFENQYNGDGSYDYGIIRHEDGTVTRD